MSGTILWVGGGLVLILFIAGIVVTLTGERELVEERIEKYLEVSEGELEFGSSEIDVAEEEKTSALTDWINNQVIKTDFGSKTATMLARADLKFKPGEYVALMIIASIMTGFLGYFFGGGSDAGISAQIFALVGLVVGLFLPRIFVSRQQAKRLNSFNAQLPDMLNLMVNGLRAGFSTMQALEAVSKELPPPLCSEFRRVVQEMQLGIPMERALDNLINRIPSEDLDLVITAINVQREVGGNLAEVLDTISHTIRERIRIKGEIKTLTTQVSYSGKFLAVIPIVLSGVLWLVNRNYFMQFFSSDPAICGYAILGCSLIMIVLGWIVMNKLSDIEV
ncbi:MAG: type II secretion system F family protein [Anaerolineales bacterium]|jgi:tight adherence protein B